MLVRIVSGVIGIPITLLLVFWPGGMPFAALIGVAALVGIMEFCRAARKGGFKPHLSLGLLGAVAVVLSAARGYELIGTIMAALVVISLAFELTRDQRAPLVNTGTTVLGVLYAAWLLAHMVLIRDFDGRIVIGRWQSDLGAGLVMFCFLTTWALDSGAYFIGKFYGRKKLVPNISPGKTVEGSVAGFVSAVIMGAVLGAVLKIPQPHGLILGGLVGIVGQCGDLAASAIKREVGLKDYGSLIPGHGGILDRVDSLLFVAPVVYYYVFYVLGEWIKQVR